MPYLSRIYINPLRSLGQRYLRDPQFLHTEVLGGISSPDVADRVLWRLEVQPHRAAVIVLTRSRPSWEHMVERAGWPGVDEPQALVRPYNGLLDSIARGRQFALLVKANPTSSTKHPQAPSAVQKERLAEHSRPRGVRVPHRTVEHQLAWFRDRIERWGFTPLTDEHDVPAVRLVARDRMSFKKKPTDDHRVTLQTATYSALVAIDDPDAARRSLLDGVGPGKAYGLGLITLAPPVPTSGQV